MTGSNAEHTMEMFMNADNTVLYLNHLCFLFFFKSINVICNPGGAVVDEHGFNWTITSVMTLFFSYFWHKCL